MYTEDFYLCPNCFEPIDSSNNICKHCNYVLTKKSKNIYALPPMTVIAQRYILGRVLGSGGFGITYIAKDLLNEKIYAVKEYLPFNWIYRNDTEICPTSDQKKIMFEHGKKRFLDEAKMLNKFSHNKNIVHVENFFASNNTAYLVMEYLDGVNFRTLINKNGGKVPFNVAKEVFLLVANALKDIHSQNVLHRDISAENIYITKNAEVKLIDFGSARFVSADSDKSLSIMLKPGTAPIEQYSNKGNQGPWTDIYSLASTFYLAVTGIPVLEATKRFQNDSLVPIGELCPDIPKDWQNVIEKSLKLSYKDRYQNITELIGDINVDAQQSSNNPIKPIQKPIFDISATSSTNKKKEAKPFLIIEKSHSGIVKNKKIELESYHKYYIGRSVKKSDIVVDMADWVSRQHCIIVYIPKDNCFYIKDISANGTYLSNNAKLSGDKFEMVGANSIIYLGTTDTAIRVVIE